MRKKMTVLSFILLCLVVFNTLGHGAGASSDRGQEFPDTVIKISSRAYRDYLKKHPPLDRLYCRGEYCFFLVNGSELRQVEASGTEILDLTSVLAVPRGSSMKPQISSAQGDINGAYHNYDETCSLLRDLETRFPNMAQVITIGYSIEGRELNVIKISDNVRSNENEPNVFIAGCQHAREWTSVEIPLLFAKYLLENYSLDPQVQRAVDGAQIYIMPIQNPDGLEFSINTYRFWSKNRHYNGDLSWGVDISRNYGFMWGCDDNGPSLSPNSGVYGGTAPFSEPETEALWQFLSAYPPAGSIRFHNYGQAILYPWGYDAAPGPDVARMNNIAREITRRISLANGRIYTYGSLATALYLSNGDFTDWIYGTFGSPAFTIELSPDDIAENSFFTSEQIIASAFAEHLPGLLYFSNYFIPRLAENSRIVIDPDGRNDLLNIKTIATDYYRAVVNADGSLTFTDKNTGAIILDSSPLVYFNSQKLSNGNNIEQQSTSTGDTATIKIIDNENPFATVTHCYQFNTHSPYIDYTVTWRYKKEGYTSEERFDFIVPGQDAQVLTRDLRLTRFNPINTYWSDLYTPKVIKFANGLYFLGSDTMESMKIQASEGNTQVSFYSDYSNNHPHFHYVKKGDVTKVFTNETQRNENDTSAASIRFAIDTGESLRCLIKNRQPYGYDAGLVFTSHPDSWTIEAAKAVAYGSANENDACFGYKGIVGRGLGWTHGIFKNGQWYSLEYQDETVKKFIDKIFRDGVEIAPHSITLSADNRAVVEQGLETLSQYNARNWIDHGASTGSDNFEDLASQGAIKNNKYYILDILAEFNYRYAWSYIDLTTENYEINLLKPGETAAIRPVLFYNNQLDDNPNDNKKIFLWSTMNTMKKVDLFYTAAHVDTLIEERGVHIGHEYFGHHKCENHAFYNNNGVIEIYPVFDAQLEYIAQKRADGLVWSPTVVELADYWVALKDVLVFYNNNGTITVANNSPAAITGLTLLAEDDIRSVIIDNNDLVSFGGSYGNRELVLPTIPAGKSVVLRVSYGTKNPCFPTIVSNNVGKNKGKNKTNEITAYWSNAKKTLTMTAAAHSGRHSFTVKVPVFANKTVTVTNIDPGVMMVGNYKASSAGEFTFETELKSIHTFEIKTSSPFPSIPPQISLDHTQLNFGAKKTGLQTPSQSILIANSGGNILNWSIEHNLAWLKVTPSSGKNAGSVTISVEPAELLPGTYTGIISVVAPNAANSPQKVNITLTVYEPQFTGSPIGSFDTPSQEAVHGCVAFTGWALDNIGVENVKLYREAGQSSVYLGDAVFIPGARPDVEKAFPSYPLNDRAGWGYMMLTNFLPDAGNGTFKIQAVASDKEGNTVTLGIKTIIADNAGAVKPFGTIDKPEQGGTAFGSNYRIDGWVLTPMPNSIPAHGSTINIYIDGIYLGHPTYNIYRSDVATLFPGYANSNGAYAYLDIDTTAYRNGIHQIYWIVTDSAGNQEGIGSRFFSIRNTAAACSYKCPH